MNKPRPSERRCRLLALALSGLLYAAAGTAVWLHVQRLPAGRPIVIQMQAVRLQFARMELRSAEEPPPPEPVPVPETADVALEPMPEEPEPEPEPVPAEAQVMQEAAAPEAPQADTDALLRWVYEQIEKEKYYPAAAQRAGYEGTFRLRIRVGADGVIAGAEVLGGRGHPLLRRSLERIAGALVGRGYGQPLPETVDLPFEFQFKLN